MKLNYKFRSAAAIALALVMATSALPGCTGGGKKPAEKKPTSQTQQVTPQKGKEDKKAVADKDNKKEDKKQDIPETKLPNGYTDKTDTGSGSQTEEKMDDKGSSSKDDQKKDDKGSSSKDDQKKDDKGSSSKGDQKKSDKDSKKANTKKSSQKTPNKTLKKKFAKTPAVSDSSSLKKAPSAKAGK